MKGLIGKEIYWRGPDSRGGQHYAGTVVDVIKSKFVVLVRYQVGVFRGELKLLTYNPRNKTQPWLIKPVIESVMASRFESEADFQKAIESNFDVSLPSLGKIPPCIPASIENIVAEGPLPRIPSRASLPEIISIIERSNLRYSSGRMASKEAIAIALSNQPENVKLKRRLEKAKRYFRKYSLMEVAS